LIKRSSTSPAREYLVVFGAALLFAMLAGGCASTPSYYVEPQLPAEQLAVINSGSVKYSYRRVSISTIDGRELDHVHGSIRLSPGPHRLKLFVSSSGLAILFGEVELYLEAQARRTYAIGGTIEYGTAHVWITDDATKQVVAQGTQTTATTGGP
jgi:hypothetical protein